MNNKHTKAIMHSAIDELYHYGILGMKWGVRRYQPYPKGYKGDGKFTGKRKTSNTIRGIVKRHRSEMKSIDKLERNPKTSFEDSQALGQRAYEARRAAYSGLDELGVYDSFRQKIKDNQSKRKKAEKEFVAFMRDDRNYKDPSAARYHIEEAAKLNDWKDDDTKKKAKALSDKLYELESSEYVLSRKFANEIVKDNYSSIPFIDAKKKAWAMELISSYLGDKMYA